MERLSLEARVLYSIFCLFMLFGVGTSFWLAHDSGLGGQDATRRYYRGDGPTASTSAPPSAPSAGDDGPALELPDDVAAADDAIGLGARLEKPARQVVETFHFHAFTMPVCLLIVGHIFMMGAGSTRRKVIVIILASTSTLLHLCLPPLVRFSGDAGGATWAALFLPSAVVMALTWAVMLVQPLVQLWLPTRADATGGSPTVEA